MEQIDYKKKYEEAIERLKQYDREHSSGYSIKERDEFIFPELRESDEEKIRKSLMQNLKERFGTKGNMGEGLNMPDVLAWLEKQGMSYTKKDVDDAYLEGVTNTKNEIEKQYEANYQIRKDIATFIFNYRGDLKDRAKWMDYLGIKVSFVENQENQETLCNKCKKEQPSHSCQDITELGRCAVEHERKPTDKVESKFKVGDNSTTLHNYHYLSK